MFNQGFDKYVCVGDSITCTVDGFDVTATIYADDCPDRPDERQDGFWPSLDPEDAGYIGDNKTRDDLYAAMHKAHSIMNAWERDEWFYCGVSLKVERNGITILEPHFAALWGIEANYPESDNSYLTETANELLPEALKLTRENLAKLCPSPDVNLIHLLRKRQEQATNAEFLGRTITAKDYDVASALRSAALALESQQ